MLLYVFAVCALVVDMNKKNRINHKEMLSVLLSIIFAILLSAPYIIYREQIQQIAFVGYLSVAIACAISNISIFLPSSSTLIVVVAASSLDPILCILTGGLGTALGEQSSYICGRIGRMGLDDNGNKEKKVLKWIKNHDALTVFIFAFLPLPIFDIVGIAAGVLRMNWIKYLVSAVLGKTLKFFFAVIGVYYIFPFIGGTGCAIIEKFLAGFAIIY